MKTIVRAVATEEGGDQFDLNNYIRIIHLYIKPVRTLFWFLDWYPGKRQALLNVVPGEYTDDDITPISFYPLLPTLDW